MKAQSSSAAPVTRDWPSPLGSEMVLVTSPKAWSQPWLVPTRMRRNRFPPTADRVAVRLPDTWEKLYSTADGAESMTSPMMLLRFTAGGFGATTVEVSPPAANWMTAFLMLFTWVVATYGSRAALVYAKLVRGISVALVLAAGCRGCGCSRSGRSWRWTRPTGRWTS